ncbi:MAG: M14 family metallopeptidase [Candidatus Kryptonium sp.]|nr:M14 family metallopeptidase [Candidatus Kryptonium sp.]MDW8109367.1 M14 family metallopeptidase [Candidatus Kryptonium sp.]
MKRRIGFIFFTFVILAFNLSIAQISSPEKFFGFKIGEDRKLIGWDEIVRYLSYVDKNSERIIIEELGKTTLGKSFIVVVASSEKNMKDLQRLKSIQRKLAKPYDLDEREARNLIRDGKVFVLITMNIHSTEIASSQESVELVYEFATRNDEEMRNILDNCVILLIPSLNPDGQQMVVDWYKKHLGTKYESSPMPWLYHYYAGHDNNRDWHFFSLVETRLTAKVLYHDWFPQVVFDQHQMGSNGPRFFVPPYSDPVNPNVLPEIMALTNLFGKYIVFDMIQKGFKGVVTGGRFNAYFQGTMSKTPLWHNRVGILSEAASVRIATPIYIPYGSVEGLGDEIPDNSLSNNNLYPFEEGWWRLRDIIDYEKAATYAILNFSSLNREKILWTFYSANKKSIQKGMTEPPFAYLIDLNSQHDPNSAIELVKRLQFAGIEIYKAKRSFNVGNVIFSENTIVIPLAQPSRPFIKDVMEVQNYPDIRLYPDGPPKRPYDVTAWTLPLQMGVDVFELKEKVDLPIQKIEKVDFGDSKFSGKGRYFVIDRRFINSYRLVNLLLKSGVKVFYSKDTRFKGSFVVKNERDVYNKINSQARNLGLEIKLLDDIADTNLVEIKSKKIGIYQPWITSMDEGWTRLVLDSFYFDYIVLHNQDIKEKKTFDELDVLILPSMGASAIVEGREFREQRRIDLPQIPEEYSGGIGKQGVDNIREFIRKGGTLVALGEASDFVIEQIGVPVRNILKNVSIKEFFAPGTIVKLKINAPDNPLAYGLRGYVPAYMINSIAFETSPYSNEVSTIASFDNAEILLSGYLLGAEKIKGKSALCEVPYDKGKIIMFAFRTQHRSQTWATFKFLFNAILN